MSTQTKPRAVSQWEAQHKTFYAKRLKKVNPHFPENRVILLERDERHATSDNPLGELLISEGRTFRAYPTPAIKRLIGTAIEEVDPRKPASTSAEPAPDAITTILDDEKLVAFLQKAGVDTIPDLVDWWVSGRIDGLQGFSEARKARVRSALLAYGLIKVDGDELDKLTGS